MKTAVSIPNELFLWAEKHAKAHNLSRSHVYAEALRRMKAEEITRHLNEIYASEDNRDPVLQATSAAALAKEEW